MEFQASEEAEYRDRLKIKIKFCEPAPLDFTPFATWNIFTYIIELYAWTNFSQNPEFSFYGLDGSKNYAEIDN